jgi:hypothetical protein
VSDVSQELANLVKDGLKTKTFSSGSKGFHATGKIRVEGDRYQAQAQAVLIGSKDDPKARIKAKPDEAVAALTAFTENGLKAKEFSSGRTGYFATGKTEIGGQRYQVQAQAVRLDG